MFDIGFWELSLVAVVSLLVLGPERLPKAARLVGFWIGKAQRVVSSLKQEIKEELRTEEFRRALQDHSPETEIRTLLEDTSNAVKSISDTGNDLEQTARSDIKTKASGQTEQADGEESPSGRG